jgi:beta-lactamase regulating signal transducer with metallopeptidase domain
LIYAVWIPLLMPLFAVPAGRRLSETVPPRAAAWAIGSCALVLGLCSGAALGLMVVAGLLRIAPVATLGHLSPRFLGDSTPLTIPSAWAAAVLLLVSFGALVRTAARCRRELRRAQEEAGQDEADGELSVRRDSLPYAYALPGKRGRIVISTAMLRALGADEREALFAHERAHLSGRHHLFLTAGRLAATLHPVLHGLREPLTYALERWADEAAAERVGDRRLTARAIGRAALATRRRGGGPAFSLAAATGPVPRRVSALLGTERPASRPRYYRAHHAVAALLLACLAISASSALDAADDLHGSVEVAQSDTAAR